MQCTRRCSEWTQPHTTPIACPCHHQQQTRGHKGVAWRATTKREATEEQTGEWRWPQPFPKKRKKDQTVLCLSARKEEMTGWGVSHV